MKRLIILALGMGSLLSLTTSCASRCVRPAVNITPGSCGEKMDWRYGATDIRIQTSRVTRQLMDKWYIRANQGHTIQVSYLLLVIVVCYLF